MNPVYLIVGVAVLFALAFFARRGGGGAKLVIESPKLGFLNLKGTAGEQLLAEDKAAFGAMFAGIQESSALPPQCDVLFVYCDVKRDGSVSGTEGGVRDIIRDSGARIVVVASANEIGSYAATTKAATYGQANLVMTLDRRGARFPAFYSRLFSEMMNGTTMPVAWVKFAPQIPGKDHPDSPEGVFVCELGQIAFK